MWYNFTQLYWALPIATERAMRMIFHFLPSALRRLSWAFSRAASRAFLSFRSLSAHRIRNQNKKRAASGAAEWKTSLDLPKMSWAEAFSLQVFSFAVQLLGKSFSFSSSLLFRFPVFPSDFLHNSELFVSSPFLLETPVKDWEGKNFTFFLLRERVESSIQFSSLVSLVCIASCCDFTCFRLLCALIT